MNDTPLRARVFRWRFSGILGSAQRFVTVLPRKAGSDTEPITCPVLQPIPQMGTGKQDIRNGVGGSLPAETTGVYFP